MSDYERLSVIDVPGEVFVPDLIWQQRRALDALWVKNALLSNAILGVGLSWNAFRMRQLNSEFGITNLQAVVYHRNRYARLLINTDEMAKADVDFYVQYWNCYDWLMTVGAERWIESVDRMIDEMVDLEAVLNEEEHRCSQQILGQPLSLRLRSLKLSRAGQSMPSVLTY